ncbi:hypothetical protein IM543_12700 [Massilia sp. UMI-21]|nr:hypothetical protein IM543_12700 [Massilia sp. UMI-21]
MELKQAQLAFSLKQEELTRLNKVAAALASELGSVKQALHLEREASRNQAKKIEQLQAVEARAAVLEAQLVDSRTRLAGAGETAARADIASGEVRRQISALEVELSAAKSAIALEERLAKLDKAVAVGCKFVRDIRAAQSNSFTSKDLTALLLRSAATACPNPACKTSHNLYYVKSDLV